MADQAAGARTKRKQADAAREADASRQATANVALLERLLRDAITYLDGEHGAALYRRALSATPEDLSRDKLSTQDAVAAARALAHLATFANLAEDVAGRRRTDA